MPKKIIRSTTIDQICKGLRILEKYKATSNVYGCQRSGCSLELQEEEFAEITAEDKNMLLELNWQTNGYYLWWV